MKSVCTVAMATLVMSSLAAAEDWLGFRGPNRSGVSTSEGVPTEWSDTKNLKWKLPLPGAGYSSPIVVGDHVYVTCFTGGTSDLKRQLVKVNRETGKQVWSKEVESTAKEQEIPQFAGRPGFASHTPVSDGERIYAHFGNSGVYAFDMDGEVLWTKKVGSEERARFGSGSSPTLYKNMLIVQAGSESETLYAFDKTSGDELWKVPAQSLNQSYSSPVIGKSDKGVDELLIGVSGEVWSLDPNKKGKFNWFAETDTPRAMCPVILVNKGVAYAVGGRGGGRTAVRLGGKDNVTSSHTVWSKRGSSYVPSPVIHGEYMYFVNDDGIVTCVNLKDGETAGRNRIGGKFYASITLIGDKLYALSRYTGTHVLEANPELKEIAHNELSDDTDHSACPAVSNGQLFIRSNKALYCIASE